MVMIVIFGPLHSPIYYYSLNMLYFITYIYIPQSLQLSMI